MIPAKRESVSINFDREKSKDSIFEWFEQRVHTFYIIGLAYMKDQKQLEELFYRSINRVHKEMPRFKNDKLTFDTWATSIFLKNCQEISSTQNTEESEPHKDVFSAVSQLEGYEKEAILLTYIKGISKEEAAKLLQVSVSEMHQLLFSGIQSLRKEMGYQTSFNGCMEYKKDYLDYLDRSLERSRKIDFEIHIYHCQNCQEDLGTFQEVMLTMLALPESTKDFSVPPDIMGNVKGRLAEEEKQRKEKFHKRKKRGLILAGIFSFLIGMGFITGLFANLYYLWTEEDEELLAYLQEGLAERLNMEAESEGVTIKIKGVIADELQTLIFYEIEDTKENNQLTMFYQDGVYVRNQFKVLNNDIYPRYYSPFYETDDEDKKDENVYRGKMSLPPLKKESGTIELQIKKVQTLIRENSNGRNYYSYDSANYRTGDWNFEIPVTKQPSIEYALDESIEVEGVPVKFDKLTIAPTTTILQFRTSNEYSMKQIEFLNLKSLVVNNEKVKADIYGGFYSDSQEVPNWNTFQTNFDPIIGEEPRELQVQLESVYLRYHDPINIELNPSQDYPQTFEYAGSTISIDKVEVGHPTEVIFSNHEVENRAYESLQFHIVDEKENNSMEMYSEGVLVDKNGKVYDSNDMSIQYEEIENPRHFETVQRILLNSNNPEEAVIPKRIEIYGYNMMKYLNDVVKVSVKNKK